MITIHTFFKHISSVLLRSAVVLSVLVCIAGIAYSQTISLYSGREFLFAYPPFIENADNWELHISSLRPVTVTFSDGIIADYSVTVVPDVPAVVKNIWQQVRAVERSEVSLRRSVRITSPTPITILAVHDSGYVVPLIPVEQWGTSYAHATREIRSRSGDGFLLIAAQDSTNISIQLRGTDAGFGNTAQSERGRNIGERWSVNLQQGEAYLVVADSIRLGTELAGTSVIANKPIGMISFYKSSPNASALIASAFSLTTLGGRRFAFAPSTEGDEFRFLSGSDNTTMRLRAFRSGGNTAPVTQVLTLQQGESFSLKTQEQMLYLWEADKPATLSYSAAGDEPKDFSPIVPIEQFSRESIVHLPPYSSNASLFILAEGDPSNRIRHEQILRGLTLNGESLLLRYPSILGNRIPETALYFLNISLPSSTRSIRLTSILPHSSTIAFKLPHGQSFFSLPTVVNQGIDTLSPQFTKKDSCSIYIYTLSDTVSLPSEGNLPPQQDRGIISVNFDSVDNIEFLQIPNLNQPIERLIVTVRPKNRTVDGFAILRIVDAAGNISIDTIRYTAPLLQSSSDRLDFGITRLGNTRTLPLTVTNRSKTALLLSKIIASNAPFRVLTPSITDTILNAGASLTLILEYAPTQEYVNNISEQALLQAITPCDTLILATLSGKGGVPRMVVHSWNAGDVLLDSTRCLTNGLALSNIGTDTLVITEITGVVLPFSLSRPTVPPLPISIPPEQTIMLKEICFTPTELGKKQLTVRFLSNAEQLITTSEWFGVGVRSGFIAEPLNAGSERVLVSRDTSIRLYNGGNSAVIINSAQVVHGTNFTLIEFIAGTGERLPFPFVERPTIEPNQYATLRISFQPTTTGTLTDSLLLRTNSGSVATSVFTGFGTLPIPSALDIDFGTRAFVGGQVVDTIISVENLSVNEKLIVSDIRFALPTVTPDTSSERTFSLMRPDLPFTLRPNRPHGPEKIDVPLRFRLPNGSTSATILIMSNAVTGPDTNGVNDTLAIQVRGKGIPILKPIVFNSSDVAFSTLICNDTVVSLTLYNTNNYAVTYDSISLITSEAGIFQLISSVQGDTLAANDSITLNIRFTPQQRKIYTAQIRINADTLSAQATINAAGVVQPIWLLAPQPKERFMPGNTVQLVFRAETSRKITISECIIEVMYSAQALIINQTSLRSEQDNLQITILENTPGKLVLRCVGEIDNGDLISVQARIYTVPERIIPISLRVLNAPSCLLTYVEPGGIVMSEYCLQGSRQLKFGNTLFSLNAPSPNPVTDVAEIRFAVGFDVYTSIELLQADGTIVSTLVQEIKKAGEHTLRLDTRSLSSGVYIIRCIAGPFSNIQCLFIVK